MIPLSELTISVQESMEVPGHGTFRTVQAPFAVVRLDECWEINEWKTDTYGWGAIAVVYSEDAAYLCINAMIESALRNRRSPPTFTFEGSAGRWISSSPLYAYTSATSSSSNSITWDEFQKVIASLESSKEYKEKGGII